MTPEIARALLDDDFLSMVISGPQVKDLAAAYLAEVEARQRAEAEQRKWRDDFFALENALAEMTRRRDEWRAKAEGYDAVRLALRDAIAGKFGEDGPRTMSRIMWAGVAADEKKRADDAEAEVARLTAERDAAVAASQKLAAENARLVDFVSELADYKPTIISGRRRDPQDDVDDMMPLPEFEAFQDDARAFLAGGDK